MQLRSLRGRLTAGIIGFTALGLGGSVFWLSWRMEQILIMTHKQNIQYIAGRFPEDIARFRESEDLRSGLQPATDFLSMGNVLLWVKDHDNKLVASVSPENYPDLDVDQILAEIPKYVLFPKVQLIQGRYFVFCSTPLIVQGENLGMVAIAQDITEDQTMLLMLVRNLVMISFVVLMVAIVGISLYIRRSLQPLREMSKMAGEISPANLDQAQLTLQTAPQEVEELAQACNLMLSRLSETWEQQRQLVGNVSHELRTPLTIVQGYIQSLLRRGDNLTEAQREALTVAASEAERTTQLLQDLLDLARAESGFLHLNIGEFILNDLIEEIVSMSTKISKRNIELVGMQKLVEICGDRNRLKQVFINLIDNALKYSPEHTTVTVELRQLSKHVEVDISDQGDGIPLMDQARIFDRFYRADEARTRSGGSGLGLAIVKTLITQMGGNITVRSQPQKGSTFTVMLPLKTKKL
ncbi:cell wall metabolism sensor histidine kinase WalK [[Leptolyngbya] sp. PCC 7376]|uniref:sensor histidine kinase n=1 Tax=[Leptolyngbya] sp. PCC 7376 TaxID=111781 RepID=UPI001CECEBA8|nr:ATP-binding protein [[Leptolyngbya] sp. PCC 7376]